MGAARVEILLDYLCVIDTVVLVLVLSVVLARALPSLAQLQNTRRSAYASRAALDRRSDAMSDVMSEVIPAPRPHAAATHVSDRSYGRASISEPNLVSDVRWQSNSAEQHTRDQSAGVRLQQLPRSCASPVRMCANTREPPPTPGSPPLPPSAARELTNRGGHRVGALR
jgi:hypothetical protein